MPIQTSYNYTNLPPWFEAAQKAALEQSQAISREPYMPYRGERTAPFSKEQQEAQRLGTNTGLYQPYYNQAHQAFIRSGESYPEAYKRYENPYMEQVVNRIADLGDRFYKEKIMPGLESTFVGLGQHGSMQHREMLLRAARDVEESTKAQQAQALYHGHGEGARHHEADRLRALQSGQELSNLGRNTQAGNVADIAQLENAGQQRQGMQQQNLDTAYQDFLNQRAFPRSQLGEHMGAIQGLPHSQMTYERTQFPNQYHAQPTPGRPDTLSNIGSLAGQLYGFNQMRRKKGGVIPKPKGKKLGKTTMSTSSFVRQPKVGGKHTIPRRIL